MKQILHSQIFGTGFPMVILHGFLGMSDNWKTLGKKFASLGLQVHLVDQRNHGRSFHSDDFNYHVMVEDLNLYLKHYKIDHAVLLGHSMGGKTAMRFSTTYPEKVKGLIVADIAPKLYPQHHQDIFKALSLLDFSIVKTRKQADEILKTYIDNFGVRQFLLKNLYWKEKGILAFRMNLESLKSNSLEIGKALPVNSKYNESTIFIKGGQSGYIEDADQMIIKTYFPNSEIKNIEKAGHWLHAEAPQLFYEIVVAFLQERLEIL